MIYLESKEHPEYFAIYDTFEEFDATTKKWYLEKKFSEEDKGFSPMEYILRYYNLYFNGVKILA